uniref:Uncharacterized protein n=1 Tax=Plectus sambesii TaxID=2011161 RepID=A0A914XP59_9BILA
MQPMNERTWRARKRSAGGSRRRRREWRRGAAGSLNENGRRAVDAAPTRRPSSRRPTARTSTQRLAREAVVVRFDRNGVMRGGGGARQATLIDGRKLKRQAAVRTQRRVIADGVATKNGARVINPTYARAKAVRRRRRRRLDQKPLEQVVADR